MIHYQNQGRDIITTNDGRPKESKWARKIDVVTTADIERLADGTFQKKEQTDEKPR